MPRKHAWARSLFVLVAVVPMFCSCQVAQDFVRGFAQGVGDGTQQVVAARLLQNFGPKARLPAMPQVPPEATVATVATPVCGERRSGN